MAATYDMTGSLKSLLLVTSTGEDVINLNPQRVYELHNLAATTPYFSTNAAAVVATGATTEGGGRLAAPVAGPALAHSVRLAHVAQLRIKDSGAGLVMIVCCG